jgi:agmatine deiminase
MSHDGVGTPAAEGFWMPPEWDRHAGCLMAWPVRRELWRDRLEDAERDYADVARAIAAFEPVVMVCPPGFEARVRDRCGAGVDPLPIPIDDSWTRDSGPVFVRNAGGDVAAVSFRFNAWGGRWHPHDDDDRLAGRVAAHLGMRCYSAPFVLEGGAFLVDGEGTLVTTEQCLLHRNRNPDLDRGQIEQGLRDYLGVSTIVWLGTGHSLDVGPEGTDGHVDGVAQLVAPGHLLLDAPTDPAHPEYRGGVDNLARLSAARDARGRPFQVTRLDTGPEAGVSYANSYLANGAVIVPVDGGAADRDALDLIGGLHPTREVVAVPGRTLAFGGGGPHCITQQIPVGDPAPTRRQVVRQRTTDPGHSSPPASRG